MPAVVTGAERILTARHGHATGPARNGDANCLPKRGPGRRGDQRSRDQDALHGFPFARGSRGPAASVSEDSREKNLRLGRPRGEAVRAIRPGGGGCQRSGLSRQAGEGIVLSLRDVEISEAHLVLGAFAPVQVARSGALRLVCRAVVPVALDRDAVARLDALGSLERVGALPVAV